MAPVRIQAVAPIRTQAGTRLPVRQALPFVEPEPTQGPVQAQRWASSSPDAMLTARDAAAAAGAQAAVPRQAPVLPSAPVVHRRAAPARAARTCRATPAHAVRSRPAHTRAKRALRRAVARALQWLLMETCGRSCGSAVRRISQRLTRTSAAGRSIRQANCSTILPARRRTGLTTIFTSWPNLVTSANNLASLTPRNCPRVMRDIFD